MNPELIERPHEIAYYQEQQEMGRREQVTFRSALALLVIGGLVGFFWRAIFGWIF